MDQLFELFLEIIFQLVAEIVIAIVEHLFGKKARTYTPNLVVKRVSYLFGGAVIGWISLFIFPHHFINNTPLRVASLVISPLATGLLMGLFGKWRRSYDKLTVDMETFTYGFLLAFSIALIRLIWTV